MSKVIHLSEAKEKKGVTRNFSKYPEGADADAMLDTVSLFALSCLKLHKAVEAQDKKSVDRALEIMYYAAGYDPYYDEAEGRAYLPVYSKDIDWLEEEDVMELAMMLMFDSSDEEEEA